jgi:riboflavin kinase/FMN adenylyltransferase
VVATFDPHPVRHFAPHVPWFRLTTLDQREELFAAAGAAAMLVFEFDDDLAATTAEDFVGELLARHLGAAGVVTGEDFTFGKARGGHHRAARRGRRPPRIAARAVGPVGDGDNRGLVEAASATRSRPASARPRRG